MIQTGQVWARYDDSYYIKIKSVGSVNALVVYGLTPIKFGVGSIDIPLDRFGIFYRLVIQPATID